MSNKVLMIASVASMIQQFNMNNIKILVQMGYQVEVACNFENGNTTFREFVWEYLFCTFSRMPCLTTFLFSVII